jgi:hypothetical protein
MHINKFFLNNMKGYIIYNSNNFTLWKRQNYGDSMATGGCQKLGVRGEK